MFGDCPGVGTRRGVARTAGTAATSMEDADNFMLEEEGLL